ncbi:Homoserine dehydrogenase, partial [human gut metagenome]
QLANVAGVFAEHEVSIDSVRQSAYVGGSRAVVTIVTHRAAVAHLEAAVAGLRSEARVLDVVGIGVQL